MVIIMILRIIYLMMINVNKKKMMALRITMTITRLTMININHNQTSDGYKGTTVTIIRRPKARAAPGTTAGVELVFVGSSLPFASRAICC